MIHFFTNLLEMFDRNTHMHVKQTSLNLFNGLVENLNSFFDGLEGLFTGLGNGVTERHLSNQFPGAGDVPFLLDEFIDQGAVMLKRAAEAFSFKSSPDDELSHTSGVLREAGKSRSISGESFLHLLDGNVIFEEQDGAVTSTETLHFFSGRGEVFRGNNALEDIGSELPEFIRLVLKEDDSSGRLRVERRRNVLNSVFNDFSDLGFRDFDILVNGVESSSIFNSGKEVLGVHFVILNVKFFVLFNICFICRFDFETQYL